MKTRSIAVVLSLLALLLAVPAVAQEEPKPGAPAMGGPDMEAMMKAMTPGAEQKQLADLAGDWTYTSKMWMAPGQPPADSGGTIHGSVLLGGRYVEQRWQGTFMGMPFEGRGIYAYDNVAKQYFSSWIDNLGTGILNQSGTCDANKTCTYTGDMWDPSNGQKTTMKSVVSWPDGNTFKLEMYTNDPTGKEMKMMEITAKRK